MRSDTDGGRNRPRPQGARPCDFGRGTRLLRCLDARRCPPASGSGGPRLRCHGEPRPPQLPGHRRPAAEEEPVLHLPGLGGDARRKVFLHKRDRDGQWWPLPVESESGGRWTIPRESKTVFKNHADHVFGGQTWLDVLSQMGGCPCDFVDCWNLIINQRLQAAISPRLVCHAGASTPSS